MRKKQQTIKISTLAICLISTLTVVSISFNVFQMNLINFLKKPYIDIVHLKIKYETVNQELIEAMDNFRNQKDNYFDPLYHQIEEKEKNLYVYNLDEPMGGEN